MSDAYEKVKGGRLTFKGGVLASRSKSIDKKHKKKKKNNQPQQITTDDGVLAGDEIPPNIDADEDDSSAATVAAEDIYTIDAAKRRKYDELFPVEAKKFGYDPKSSTVKSVEEALDDRVKKKADRYCK